MAYWIDKDGISDFFYCSECNYKAHYTETGDRCPNCGCIIDEESRTEIEDE